MGLRHQRGKFPPATRQGDQATATQRSRQAPDERNEHGSVPPLQAGSGPGASEHGDLVPQHEDLDVLRPSGN
jgi:hypothetical protein